MKAIFKRYYLFLICIFLAALFFSIPTQQAWALWQHFDPNNTNGKLASSQITTLLLSLNRLWIGTDMGLVAFDTELIDPNDPDMLWIEYPEIDPNYAPITAMDIDPDGIIWLGTPKGLVSFDPDEPDPNSRVIVHGFTGSSPLIEDIEADTNFVWVATNDSGLNRYDKSGGWKDFQGDPNGFNASSARRVASRDDGIIWVLPGSPDFFGTYSYSVIDDQWEYIAEPMGEQGVFFNAIELNGVNDIWFGSNGFGLWHYQQDIEKWTQWEQTGNGLPLNDIWAIGIDKKNNRIIVSTEAGIAKYDRNFDIWRPISTKNAFPSLDNQGIKNIIIDPDRDQVWFGTESGGLYRLFEESIIWSNPAKGSRDVPLDLDKIEVIFNKSIDPNTVFIDKIGTSVTVTNSSDPDWPYPTDFTLIWQDPNVFTHLILALSDPLEQNTWYNFTFNTGINDYSGYPINKDTLLFKTVDPPQIWDWEPEQNATDVNPGAPIKIWFNKLMDPNSFFTFPANITILPPTGSPVAINKDDVQIQDTAQGTLLIINKEFIPGTEQTITVTKNVKDRSGNSMLEGFSLTFTTKSAPQIIHMPQQPYSPFPYYGAEDVPVDTVISMTFSRPMDTNSVESNFTISPYVFGDFTWYDGDTRVIFKPDSVLESDTTYYIIVSDQAHDVENIALEAHPPWFFTTKSAPDITGQTWPKFISNVPIDVTVRVDFTDPMDPNSIMDAFCLSESPYFTSCLDVSYQWDPNYKTFYFDPNQGLTYGREYYVRISTDAQNQEGTALPEAEEWSFTTKPQPSVLSVFPTDDKVSIYTHIFAIFDQTMHQASVEGALRLLDTHTSETVSGTFIWDPYFTAFQFDPDGSLANGHIYRVTITNAAKSALDVTLPTSKVWEFTTVLANQSIEPPQGEDWPKFPIDLNLEGLPSLLDPNTNLAITAITLDENGELWAGLVLRDPWTELGLFHFDGEAWTQYTTLDGLTNDLINDLVFDTQGNLWIATQGGLSMFDGQAWHSYTPDDPNIFYIEDRDTLSYSDIQDFFKVNAIDIYSSGTGDTIWIATTGGLGVGKYNDQIGDWEWTATTNPRYQYILSVNPSNGNIWFESGNLLFWEEDKPCEAIAGLNIDVLLGNITQWPTIWDNTDMWIWAPNGVSQHKIRYQEQDQRALWAITEDAYNNLWLATNSGLYKIDINKLRDGECDYQRIDSFTTKGGLLSDLIYDVKVNPSDPNQLYVVTDQGISIYLLTADNINDPSNWTQYPLTSPAQVMLIMEFIPNGGLFIGPDAGFILMADTNAPSVVESNPKDGETGFPAGQQIRVTFSELMDTNTTQGAFALQLAGTTDKISGIFDWEGMILTFKPNLLLITGAVYVLSIDDTARDLVGNQLSQPYNASFEVSKSFISQTDPKKGQQNVQISGLQIRVDFIKPMDINTTQNAFCLKDAQSSQDPNAICIPGEFMWDGDQTLYFYPDTLFPLTAYILTIDETAKDAEGVNMPAAFSMDFITGAQVEVLRFIGDGCFVTNLKHTHEIDLWERIRGLFTTEIKGYHSNKITDLEGHMDLR